MAKRKFKDATDEEMCWTPGERRWLETVEKLLAHPPAHTRALVIYATSEGLTVVGSCCAGCNDMLLAAATAAREDDRRAELH